LVLAPLQVKRKLKISFSLDDLASIVA